MQENSELFEFINNQSTSKIVIHKNGPDVKQNGVVIEDFFIQESIGKKILCYLVRPAQKGKFPGIIFLHWLEPEAKDSNRAQFLQIAIALAKKGIVSILPDCFWTLDPAKYKENPKSYTSKWWNTKIGHDLKLIRQQLLELKTIENYFITQEFVDENKLAIGAHDFGAMFGILLANLGVKYNTLAFLAFTSHFSDWFRFGSDLTEEELTPYIEKLKFVDPINNIGKLKSANIFLGFGDDDFYVPLERAQLIDNHAIGNKKMTIYPGKHGLIQEAFSDLKNWLYSHLVENET